MFPLSVSLFPLSVALSLVWPTSLLLQHLPLFKWEQRSSFLSSVPPSQGSLPSPALFLRNALHDGKPVAPTFSIYTHTHTHTHTYTHSHSNCPSFVHDSDMCWRWAEIQLRWCEQDCTDDSLSLSLSLSLRKPHTHTHTHFIHIPNRWCGHATTQSTTVIAVLMWTCDQTSTSTFWVDWFHDSRKCGFCRCVGFGWVCSFWSICCSHAWWKSYTWKGLI